MKTIGQVIEQIYFDSGLSMREFALKVGYSRQYIYELFRNKDNDGTTRKLQLDTLKQICERTNYDLGKLLVETGYIKQQKEIPLNEKYEELELTVDYLEEGIKNGIVVAKEKFKGKIDAFKQKKLAKKIAKKQEQLDKAENEEKIEKLTKEIEELKAKLNVAQESFFVEESEVEVIEEAIKEKIGQLNNSFKQKMKDLVAKKYKKVSSINQAINAAEAQNEYFGKLLQGS